MLLLSSVILGTGPVAKKLKEILLNLGSAVSVKYIDADSLAVLNDYEIKVHFNSISYLIISKKILKLISMLLKIVKQ